ncbi:Cell division cycle protein 123-like [Spatholobus suberectus]|nr:Cell division cycle protein 123-like [Spatholobus suberectus]
MKDEEVNQCQIQEWYPKFKSVSIRTLIHQLPESFIQYLLDDSGPFLLPVSVLNEDALPNRIHNLDEEEDFKCQRDLVMKQKVLHRLLFQNLN